MNFPIYNFDYEYTLSEIVRYLKFFNNHIVHMSRPLNYSHAGTIQTTHQFKEDGLSIRLYWNPKVNFGIHGFMEFEKVLNLHKQGLLKLVGYDFIKFSGTRNLELPTKESADIYFNKVMKNRKKKPYNQEEYQLIEHLVRKPSKISDVVFDIMIQDINNLIEFEKYYSNRKEKEKEENIN